MPFLVQVGYERFYLPELIANGDLEGIILQVAHAGLPGVEGLARQGAMVLVDPQTYKLADANVRITKKMGSERFVALWPRNSGLRNNARRASFVEATVERELEMGATDVISPYLFVEDLAGPALEVTLQMAEESRALVGKSKRVWAGLYVAGTELKRQQHRDQFLNSLTASSIDHCYLIVDPEQGGSGPLADDDLIRALRHVVRVLETNDIRVMLGYSDPVGLLLMGDGLSAFASGVTASLRRLQIASQRAGSHPRRPAHPRYYLPQLMNFVRVDNEMRPALARLSRAGRAVCGCKYCSGNLRPGTQFDSADACRHFVAHLTDDARSLSNSTNRRAHVLRLINEAAGAYDLLDQAGITFSGDSGPDHIESWSRVF